MTILHVTDFHFNKRWFHWLLHHAPPHDLAVMSGDLLDRASAIPHRMQIDWVSAWLHDFPTPLLICSGQHDRQWDSAAGRWTPAYWLRSIANPNVWTDGQRISLDGLSVLSIGSTTHPKGSEADIWVAHVPPSGTRVATRAGGGDEGDPDLVASVRRHAPRLVLSGHVHGPAHWRDDTSSTLFLNPGRNPDADTPNHILVHTAYMTSRFIGGGRKPTATKSSVTVPAAVAEGAGLTAAAA